jgi:hypothetical protein
LITADEKKYLHLPTWLNDPIRRDDPAFDVSLPLMATPVLLKSIQKFLENLRNHLLSHITGEQVDEDFPSFSEAERRKVVLKSDRIYEHSHLRVFYTTYDLRRAVDSIDLSERPNVLTPAYYDKDTTIRHPFWYARVLGIYHANVSYAPDEKTKRLEFLWVRWFAWDSTKPGGWETCQLDRLTYDDKDHQFGFLDPAAVVRAAHLIPGWAHGRTTDYFPESSMVDNDSDFIYHYVNR